MLDGLLAMLYSFNAHVGAVRFGLERAVLCAAEAASSTAGGGCMARGGKRGCLAVSWVGGDHVCTRRGRRAVCGRVSRVALWRALGRLAERLGAACARGPGLGNARGWDRQWRWTVGCLPDKVGTASSSPSLLSTLGDMGGFGCSPLMTMASSQWC